MREKPQTTGAQIDAPELTLSALFDQWPATMAVFMRHGMICVGCTIAPFHTIDEACHEYDLDVDAFRAELRAVIEDVGG